MNATHSGSSHAGVVTAHEAAGDPHTGYRLESADHSHQTTGLQAGQLDHGAALTGLTDDDHTQYARLAGRAGSQVLQGGTASGEDLTLESTAHATKGDVTVLDNFQITKSWQLLGDLTPAQITSDENNYAPTGHADASIIRLSSDAARTITGLAGGTEGRVVILFNVGSFNITLANESASSTAANRFSLAGQDKILYGGSADHSLAFYYDLTRSRWQMVDGMGINRALWDALGDLLYASANNTTAKLSGNITTTRKFLRQVGDGAVSAAPAWDTLVAGDIPASLLVTGIPFIIDGGGSTITTGLKGDLVIPFNCTVTGWTVLADQSGSIVVDVWKDTYANYPPTVADTIAGSEKPTISTATKGQDLSLSTWTTSLTAGDTLRFNVDSVTTIQRVTIHLHVTRT